MAANDFKSPRLDDRTFDQLLADARRIIQEKGTNWNDLSANDPGIVLLELFAYLTEVMLYRLNRLPEKAYVEFLRLLGVTIQPSSAAAANLTFYVDQPAAKIIEIPLGTRVTVERSGGGGQEPPVFVTLQDGVIKAGQTDVTLLARNCDQVDGELVKKGTGQPGQVVRVMRPPIIADTGDRTDLIVTTEAHVDELNERIEAREYLGKTYRVWRRVENFTSLGDDRFTYMVDRNSGLIQFAPAVDLGEGAQLLAEAPGLDREIRVWYRRGGGSQGNLAENTLTVMKDPIKGVKVTNHQRATGGKAAETLENALLRGPLELHSLQRAVTAKDFELIARKFSSRAVVRAKAFTRRDLWKHAQPGQVEVMLVPDIPVEERNNVTIELLTAHQNEAVRTQIQKALDERRPLGTTCQVSWTRYKPMKVRTRIVVQREEDKDAIQRRITQRLNQTITPIPTDFNSTGWPFGQALRASNVYDIALAEPGVRWVDTVRLVVEEAPNQDVGVIAIDHSQPKTWYASSGSVLFRSLNHGDGWEAIQKFPGKILSIQSHPQVPGLLALACQQADGTGTGLFFSADCGETWPTNPDFAPEFTICGTAWTMREGVPILHLATDVGLYEVARQPGATPIPIRLNTDTDVPKSFYAVTSFTDIQGIVYVALAAQGQKGVYLSRRGGLRDSFSRLKTGALPANEDIRVLGVQAIGSQSFLWAGSTVTDSGVGNGGYRWQLRGMEDPPEGWISFKTGWQAGSCKGLAFHGVEVFAASHRLGVLRIADGTVAGGQWEAPQITCGLPLRETTTQKLFHPVDTVAATADPERLLVLAGGIEGVYSTDDEGKSWSESSQTEFIEKVTLPETSLFVSKDHEVTIVREGEDETG